MAEGKQLHELPVATQVTNADLMLLQQDSIAKQIAISTLFAATESRVNALIDEKLGVIENGSY